jgi:hypothetical protein
MAVRGVTLGPPTDAVEVVGNRIYLNQNHPAVQSSYALRTLRNQGEITQAVAAVRNGTAPWRGVFRNVRRIIPGEHTRLDEYEFVQGHARNDDLRVVVDAKTGEAWIWDHDQTAVQVAGARW